MHSGPSGLSDPSSPFKNEPPLQQLPTPLTPRFPSNLISGAPAKRITFYKSGDAQFSGVRMAIHNRSFKCFDALLDDLSQKVPLPFGVRTITTPRGTHSIKRLEQLEDGGCYLCSDRRYAKPINMELAGKRTAMWHHHSRPPSARRKPRRPEEAPPPEHASSHYYRQPKRIVLVKNTDPAVRRSIILSRRTARSLRVFMEEVSELLQCHVRKLYTIEGRKIDSIQSLIHCPSVLVCVGREPFRPLMLECRRSSEEKLPGMSVHSRSSLCSEGRESKKNVNFGLETKKSIIHPRSDSSNRSTRFSLSSEKSYPNGVCTPGQVANCPHVKETILNDDIEKRVLVNKDGSVSVEMKVRFRLTNDETLQWSTEIKKAPGAANEAIRDKEGHVHYLQQAREASEQGSSGDVEESSTPKSQPQQIEDTHCENCCNHCQEYDIWENPAHREHHTTSRHIKSSSSSASSRKIVCKKASVDSIRTISRSSEEYTEHVVEKASCYQQTVGGGDTMVEYCTISRCCSRSEVCSMAATSKTRRSHSERCSREGKIITNGERKPDMSDRRHCHPGVCCVEVTKASDAEDRPVSEISNSSKVLESLKEDQDDDEEEGATPSSSRVSSHSHGEFQSEVPSRAKSSSTLPDERLLSPKRSEASERSPKHKATPTSPSPVVQKQISPILNGRPASIGSRGSSKCHSCHCGSASPHSAASNTPVNGDEDGRPDSTVSKHSHASKESCKSHNGRSHSRKSAASNAQSAKDGGELEEKEGQEERVISSMSKGSKGSDRSSVCPHCCCGQEAESASRQSGDAADEIAVNQADQDDEDKPRSVVSTKSAASAKSDKSTKSTKGNRHSPSRDTPSASQVVNGEIEGGKESVLDERVESVQSRHSNASSESKKSSCSVCSNCRRSAVAEERSGSATTDKASGEEERVSSSLSNKSKLSQKSDCSTTNRAKTPSSNHRESPASISEDTQGRDEASSAQSETSGASEKSKLGDAEVKQGENQEQSPTEKSDSLSSLSQQTSDEEKPSPKTVDERATSVMSNRTNVSGKSHCSNCSASKAVKSLEPSTTKPATVTENEEEEETRPSSVMSAQSKTSTTSKKSTRLQNKEVANSPKPSSTESPPTSVLPSKLAAKADDEPKEDSRAPSAMSNASGRSRASRKSAVSASSRPKSPRAGSPAKINECNGTADENTVNSDTEDEQKAPSVKSNTTNASSRSKTSQRTVIAAQERGKSPRPKSPARVVEEDENTTEKRPNSSLSAKSNVSRASRQSKRGASPSSVCQESLNSPKEERPNSAMSVKSVKSSPRANETVDEEKDASKTIAGVEASNHKPVESPVNSDTVDAKEEKEDRPASAMSNRSNGSRKSKVSQKSDNAQTPRAKSPASSEKVKAGESEMRPLSSLSLNADAARSPSKTKGKEDKRSPSPTVKQHVKEEIEATSEQRPKSAMSHKSSKSQKTGHCPDTQSTAKAEEVAEKPQSASSQNVDKKSLQDTSNRAPSPAQNVSSPAGQEVSLAVNEVTERPKSALSVASRTSKKSNREPSPRPESSQSKTAKVDEEPRAPSEMSVDSNVSSKSNKCKCKHSNDSSSKNLDSALSTRSKTPQTPPECPPAKNGTDSTSTDKTVKAESESVGGQEEHKKATSPVTVEKEGQSDQKKAESVKSISSSTKTKAGSQKKEQRDRSPSALSTSSSRGTRSKSPSPSKAQEPLTNNQAEDTITNKKAENSGNEKAENVTLKDSRPKSNASVRSEKSTKSQKATKSENLSKPVSQLDVNVSTPDNDIKSDNGSVKSCKSSKKAKSVKFDKKSEKEMPQEKGPQPTSGSSSDASQNCSSPPNSEQNKTKPPTVVLTSTSSDSVLSHALSAADLLRELSGNSRPMNKTSQTSTTNEKANDTVETESKSSKHKKDSSAQDDKPSSLELVHSCLPNASPNDVVNEWLQKIPVNGPVYQMEDELNDTTAPEEAKSVDNSGEVLKKETQQEAEEQDDQQEEEIDQETERAKDPNEEAELEDDEGETEDADKTPSQEDISDTSNSPPRISLDFLEKEHLPKRSQSSVLVMKALLGPKMDRCNSLPEVSPVYGRRLSKSAEGLLDCLAKLRLIDSEPSNSFEGKYVEIMHILQSLWLYEPSEGDSKVERGTEDHATAKDEANPRSSSGVEVSSGSEASGKSHSGTGKATPVPTVVIQQQTDSEVQDADDQTADKTEDESPLEPDNEEGADKENCPDQTAVSEQENEESDPATPDVAARTKGSPDSGEKTDDAKNEVPGEELTTTESHKETTETDQPLEESSGKDKTENDPVKDASSDPQSPAQRVQLSRKVSQDPDPTWVLSLLKKIERQFMTHYANAMAEFKVRWNLDDSVMLDRMINELKVEVHKRIQESIKRELQKIQGRAGKSPRPPSSNLSKESSVQAEQRRRRLKVMKIRSLKPSNSDDSDAASGTDFSDQRSEDEYCPCDECIRKKMEARQMLRAELMNTAPVKMEFDLLKILQVKKEPSPSPKPLVPPPTVEKSESQSAVEPQKTAEEGGNLEVVQEEPEQEENGEEREEEPNETDKSETKEGDNCEEGDVEQEEEGGSKDEADEEDGAEAKDEEIAGCKAEANDPADEAEDDDKEAEMSKGNNQEAGDESTQNEAHKVSTGTIEDDDQRISKDETEDDAIAEETPMDDTEGDVNPVDSTEAVDEIEEDEEDGVRSETKADNVNKEPQDQEECNDDEEDGDTIADLKEAKKDSLEHFRNRQMTRTSVEAQPGSMDSFELDAEASTIVQSVFTSLQGQRIDRDETDDGLKTTTKKRSRSPARANKQRPKDSDVKVDDLEF